MRTGPQEEGELADVLDAMNWPKGFTLKALQEEAEGGLLELLMDRKSRRAIPHRLEKCGYVPVRNPDANDGLWKHGERRKVIYTKAALPLQEQLATAKDMVARSVNRLSQ